MNNWVDNWKCFENKDCIVTYCLFKKIEGLVLAVDWHNSFSVIIRTNEGRVLLINHITKIEIKGVDEVGK